jgi:CBS domain-containing protein
MSRDVIHVGPRDSVDEAWARLARHKVKALPVIRNDGTLAGIVSLHDFFVGHSAPDPRKMPVMSTARFVADIMTRKVRVARPEQLMVDLVGLFSDGGLHHMPVVDEQLRVVGMITQSTWWPPCSKPASATRRRHKLRRQAGAGDRRPGGDDASEAAALSMWLASGSYSWLPVPGSRSNICCLTLRSPVSRVGATNRPMAGSMLAPLWPVHRPPDQTSQVNRRRGVTCWFPELSKSVSPTGTSPGCARPGANATDRPASRHGAGDVAARDGDDTVDGMPAGEVQHEQPALAVAGHKQLLRPLLAQCVQGRHHLAFGSGHIDVVSTALGPGHFKVRHQKALPLKDGDLAHQQAWHPALAVHQDDADPDRFRLGPCGQGQAGQQDHLNHRTPVQDHGSLLK